MELKIKIHDSNAVVPAKAGPNEVGYDLTAISFVKKIGTHTFMYDTGISVEPPEGYYTEIIPRSSISKTGFEDNCLMAMMEATNNIEYCMQSTNLQEMCPYRLVYKTGNKDYCEYIPKTSSLYDSCIER